MQQSRLTYLLQRYADDAIVEAELSELAAFLREAAEPAVFTESFLPLMELYPADRKEISRFDGLAEKVLLEDHVQEADDNNNEYRGRKMKPALYLYWWAAAAVLLLAVGVWWWMTDTSNSASVVKVNAAEILPGSKGAILTLADGSQVLLDSVLNSTIVLKDGKTARVSDKGLIYDGGGHVAEYNTMTTPRGRKYQITLPDGTQVWLNSASSIRYPTSFAGNERKVEITGEVYFDVAPKPGIPFNVNVNNKAMIQVLGTRFNVNAYADEQHIATTLFQGAVRVSDLKNGSRLLKPGQQARIAQQQGPGVELVEDPDTEKVLAWKNDLFYFDGATLPEIMRQVERWYDVTVEYPQGIPNIEFEGKMTRGVSLKGLLFALEELGVHYKLKGRILQILP